ncbi:DUF1045 domain-containing protein [Sulfitobacter sp. M13]
MFKRYAIYYTPRPGDFAQRGAAWLGWDLQAGIPVEHPAIDDLDIAKLTDRPRKYGLHGTVKAPFELTKASTEAQLAEGVATFCKGQAPVQLDGLALSQIGRFLALVPQGDTTALGSLAGTANVVLDAFRAPLSEAEFTRKNAPYLTDQQRIYLKNYGYPHIMEYFRFHITLTGPLAPDQITPVKTALRRYLGTDIPAPFVIDSLTLCGEDTDGRFHEIERFTLGE